MRNPWDQFAKDLLDLLLSPHGGVRQDAVIPGTDPEHDLARWVAGKRVRVS